MQNEFIDEWARSSADVTQRNKTTKLGPNQLLWDLGVDDIWYLWWECCGEEDTRNGWQVSSCHDSGTIRGLQISNFFVVSSI